MLHQFDVAQIMAVGFLQTASDLREENLSFRPFVNKDNDYLLCSDRKKVADGS